MTNQDSRRTVRFREDDRDSVSEENQNLLCARTESSLFTPSIPVSTVSTTSFNTSPVTTTSPFAPLWTVPPLLGTPLHNATFTGLPQPALSLTELKTGSRPTLGLPPFGLVSSSSSLLPNPSHITSLPHFSVPSVNPAILPPFADSHTHLARTPDAFAGAPVTNLNFPSHSGAASEYPSQSHIPSVNSALLSPFADANTNLTQTPNTVIPSAGVPITHVDSQFGAACQHLPQSHSSAVIVPPISPLSTGSLDGHSPTSLVPAVSTTSHPQVKLPKLSIKKFNGDVTKWVTFWDSYNSSIHSNSSLSSIDKFNYLVSLVESSAAEAITGLTITAANYEEAITTLKRGLVTPS